MYVYPYTNSIFCMRAYFSFIHTHHGNTYLTPLHLFYPLKYGAWHTTIINIICVCVCTSRFLCTRAFISHHHHRRLNIVQWTEYHSRLVSLDPLAYVVQIFFPHPKHAVQISLCVVIIFSIIIENTLNNISILILI